MRPYVRVQQALDASERLIRSTLRTVAFSKRCASRRPVRVSRELGHATDLLLTASARIGRAAEQIEAMRANALRDPRDIEQVPQLLVESRHKEKEEERVRGWDDAERGWRRGAECAGACGAEDRFDR